MYLGTISLIFGPISIVTILSGFSYMTYSLYKTSKGETLSWCSLYLQTTSTICGAICAGVNMYISGIQNIPFLITNVGILLNLLVLFVLKRQITGNVIKITTPDVQWDL